MRIHVGSQVQHPVLKREGKVVDIHTNPACLLRQLVVEWDDGEIEEVEELEFGPLED